MAPVSEMRDAAVPEHACAAGPNDPSCCAACGEKLSPPPCGVCDRVDRRVVASACADCEGCAAHCECRPVAFKPTPFALTDADRAALLLPPPGVEVVEQGATTCEDCGDELLSEEEQHLQSCNPCVVRRRERFETARERRRAAGGRD